MIVSVPRLERLLAAVSPQALYLTHDASAMCVIFETDDAAVLSVVTEQLRLWTGLFDEDTVEPCGSDPLVVAPVLGSEATGPHDQLYVIGAEQGLWPLTESMKWFIRQVIKPEHTGVAKLYTSVRKDQIGRVIVRIDLREGAWELSRLYESPYVQCRAVSRDHTSVELVLSATDRDEAVVQAQSVANDIGVYPHRRARLYDPTGVLSDGTLGRMLALGEHFA